VNAAAETTLRAVRRLLLATLVAGMAGTASELLLIGHVEDSWQLVPLVLLALGTLVALAHAFTPHRFTRGALQAVMGLFLVSGGIGMVLHYRGNSEFEVEMAPSIAGFELVKESITGAFPVLAPGTMILLGLVGLAVTYRDRP
jgi:hypothetical protein